MRENLEQFKAAFVPYLRQFIERAQAEKPELTQVPIPADLLAECVPLGITLKTSFGMGAPTVIPWLACFLPGQSAGKDGVYPVILYRRDLHTISVCYGISATAQAAEGSWPRKWPNDLVGGLPHFEHEKYDQSYEFRLFPSDERQNYESMADAFLTIVDQYLSIPHNSPATLEPFMAEKRDLNSLRLQAQQDIGKAGMQLQDGLMLRLVSSLLTKRFLILTGLSGSGKTKLAHAFAAWISESTEQFRVVAVGADWTTNENLLGYQDALRPETYRKPSNGALDLMLRARTDVARPYFLILDEMNLSHVERYFADMLSAIESGQKIALHSALIELPAGDGDQVKVPQHIELPKNLFIIGTVNVDETTYMFSPKVLDRANVIEFRATVAQIASYLDNPQPVSMNALARKGAAYGAAFVATAGSDAPPLAELQATIADGAKCAADLKVLLTEAFGALAPIGAEFGFRTAFEISRFVYFHAVLTGPGWQFGGALDAQVLQKLLPKLHGSERRLRPVLDVLERFCVTYTCTESLEKIRRMQDRLKDGFTSFAEA